jgi:hypothetical protein
MIYKESELVTILFNLLLNWIDSFKNEILLNTTEKEFKEIFYTFFYKNNKYQNIIQDEKYNYFETKYNSYIIDLLSDMKKICKDYCNNTLDNINIDFLDFIYKHINLLSYNYESEEEDNNFEDN